MAHVGNGATMKAQQPGYRDAMQRPANPRSPEPGARTVVRIPDGGHATIRKIDNGVVATAHDKNYNQVQEVHADSADALDCK